MPSNKGSRALMFRWQTHNTLISEAFSFLEMLLIWGGWGGGGPRSHKHGHCNNDATTHDTWTSQDHGHSKFNAAEQRRTWHEQKRSYEELLPRHSLHMHNRFCKKRPQNCTIWSGCSVHHVNGIEHAHGATPGWGGAPRGRKVLLRGRVGMGVVVCRHSDGQVLCCLSTEKHLI